MNRNIALKPFVGTFKGLSQSGSIKIGVIEKLYENHNGIKSISYCRYDSEFNVNEVNTELNFNISNKMKSKVSKLSIDTIILVGTEGTHINLSAVCVMTYAGKIRTTSAMGVDYEQNYKSFYIDSKSNILYTIDGKSIHYDEFH